MENSNLEWQLANDFVRFTSHHIFLTGKAGTGKTTFLHSLKQDAPKRMVITAPTGVAAINAGGVTLHSFFQLAFGPFLPGSEAHRKDKKYHFSKEKRNIINSMELLVIDEISMVRCDLLDAVDLVLRHVRQCPDLPFGGTQLLMIGDLHQLSPVATHDEWNILREYYASSYFFSSAVLRGLDVVSIELKHVYRQSEAEFIELLNRVRDNRLNQATLDILNSKYVPAFEPKETEHYITLTTHNGGADHINKIRLERLAAKAYAFHATIEGDYPQQIYPTAEVLTLKQGTQVMFIRNDSATEKRYFNGKIGTVVSLGTKRIRVKCTEDDHEIDVEPVTWENVEYTIDATTKAISEKVIGKFTQYPLRLAWAITIHKSQGLTFERAIIDANAAFSPGQVYVALSRCKSFDGVVLSSPLSSRLIQTDAVVSKFMEQITNNPPNQTRLDQARIIYQQQLLQECWDFQALQISLKKLFNLLRNNQRSVQVSSTGISTIDDLEQQTIVEIVSVSEKFQRQLQSRYREDKIPEEDDYIQERVRKASAYFTEKLQQGVAKWLHGLSFTTDNKQVRKKIRQAIDDLQRTVAEKLACIEDCRKRFLTNC